MVTAVCSRGRISARMSALVESGQATYEAERVVFDLDISSSLYQIRSGKQGQFMISERRYLTVAAVIGAGALAVFALPSPAINLSYSHHPIATTRTATVISTAVDYDSNRHILSMRCVKSSSGICRFAIEDGGRQRLVSVDSGKATAVSGVLENGQICSGGAELSPTSCSWSPISDPTSGLS